MLAICVSWLALVVVTIWLGNKGWWKRFFINYGLYLFVAVILAGLSFAVTEFLLKPFPSYQPYAAMALIIMDFLVPFLLVFASPLSSLMFIPYEEGGLRIETCYERFISFHDVKFELRLLKATKLKVPLINQ